MGTKVWNWFWVIWRILNKFGLFKMSAVFARGPKWGQWESGQNFKMLQSTQKAYQITCFVVQNLKTYSIQIYQALRKDSGRLYIWGRTGIFLFFRGAKPRGKIEKLPVLRRCVDFHYPFEIKAWYICFISLLYKFKTYTKIWPNGTDLALQQGATTYHSALTEWHAQAFGVRPAAAASSCSSYTT